MSGRDWRAFDAELRARVAELAVELLGKPTLRAGQEWRWGRKGTLVFWTDDSESRSPVERWCCPASLSHDRGGEII